jgi:porin
MYARIFITTLLAGWLALAPSPLMADDSDIMAWPGITGAWGGGGQSLEARGVTLEMVYTGEFVRNFDPGLVSGSRETIYQDNLDLTVTVDTKKAGLWSGGTLFIYGLRNHGGDPTGNVIGDLQTASNIEAPDNFLVYEAWYEQQFSDNSLSVLVGLYDLNSEFLVTHYGGLFLNSSFGIEPDVSANVAVSIFPKAGLAARVRIQLFDGWYLQAVGLDGDPQTRSLNATEGKMFVVESGLSAGSGSYKAGYWLHTADKAYNGQTFNDDYGIYGIVDQELIALSGGGIGAFLQLGWTPHNRNDVTRYVGAGLHADGLIPGRDQDELGIALARAYTHGAIENTVELTWRMAIAPWLSIQPSMQWIINPGGVVAAPTIKTGLLRFEVTI